MNLNDYKKSLNSVGWFIPPYLSLGFLGVLKSAIDAEQPLDQQGLGAVLSRAYSPEHLAAMVSERYPITPHVQEYKDIIAEAVEAHFSGLGHAAVVTLLPVIEGAGRRLAKSRNLKVEGIKSVFTGLAEDCKRETASQNLGAVDEILSMMDSFIDFTSKYLYVNSNAYPLTDKTNRHGALHGAYTDGDYGSAINFYKAIGSVDFLCMVSAFRSTVSWLAPDPTPSSQRLAAYYCACQALSAMRPVTSMEP